MTDFALCIACGVEEPAPVLCITCSDRARRHMDTIGKARRMLDARPKRGRGGRPTGKPGSRPPADLTVLSMTDVRSRAIIDWNTGEYGEDHVTQVDAELVHAAQIAVEQRHLSEPLTDALDAIRIVNLSFEWYVRSDQADTFVAILETCARALSAAVSKGSRTSWGRCLTVDPSGQACNGPIQPEYDEQVSQQPLDEQTVSRVYCRVCGGVWAIADLADFGRITPLMMWDTPPRIAEILGMSERTLRHWILTKKVHRNGLGMVCHADVWRIMKERNGPQPMQTTGGLSPLITQEAT